MKIINLMEDTKGIEGCKFEHGLSFYIETKQHKLLLDTGATDAFLENAKYMGIDLTQVDTVILSHGHYDHSGGILPFSQINAKADIYMQKKNYMQMNLIQVQPYLYLYIKLLICKTTSLDYIKIFCLSSKCHGIYLHLTETTICFPWNYYLHRS